MAQDITPHYMAELVLAGRWVLVIGGGEVARRKIDGLLQCGALVTVVAPELEGQIAAWVAAGRVVHWAERFSSAWLTKEPRPCLVFVATNQAALNQEVARMCAQQGLLCNSADDPSSSGFLVPAVVRRGRVVVGVGSGGLSPALSRVLKERIDGWLEPGWGELAASFGVWRSRVMARIPAGGQRQKFWRESAQAVLSEAWIPKERLDAWFEERLKNELSE